MQLGQILNPVLINLQQLLTQNITPAMLSRTILKTLTFSFLISIIASLNSPPTLSPNNIYSSAGIVTFDTSPYYTTTNNILNPFVITVTFNGRTQPSNAYRFGYSIQDINYQIVGKQLNFSLSLGTQASTSAVINYYTNNAGKISSLKISYLIIEPLFGIYYFSFRWLSPQKNFDNSSFYIQTSSSQGPFNMASTFTIWATILGVDANLNSNNEIDLYPTITVASSTTISYKIQTILTTAFYLNSILIEAFIYDSSQIQNLNRNAFITVGTIGATFTAGLSTTDSTNSVRSYNTIIGMIGFHILSLSYLQFSSVYTPNNGISFSSSYSFNYVNFNYLIATFVYCAPATPYLFVSTRVCYDVCPVRSSTDSFYYECQSCTAYDCYYCGTNGLCTQCSAAVDFRTINASSSRCVPLDGYYDDGSHSQAVACNASACLTCTSLTFCLSCQTGKYLTSSNNCATCIANCYNCTNGTSCVQCNTGYVFLTSNNTCFLNCSTIANCLTCSYTTSLSCNSCNGGYQLASNACNSVCGDGNRTSDQNCDDGNTVNGDGCNSLCQIEPYFTCTTNALGTSVCSLTSLAVQFQSLTKDEFSNSLTLSYKVTPITANSLKSLDWSAITAQTSNLSLTLSQFSYDSSLSSLQISAQYQQTLSDRQLALQFSFPNSAPFDLLGNKSSSVSLSASNNLSLWVYDSFQYQAAYYLKFLVLGLTAFALLLFVVGYYSGKLIALQLLAIYQLAYFSMLSVSNLSPGFVALKNLCYSNIYSTALFNSSSKINSNRFYFLNYNLNFLDDFNIALPLILVPLIVSLVIFVANKVKYSSQKQTLTHYSAVFKGELTYYGLLLASYPILIAFFTIIRQAKGLKTTETICFSLSGGLFVLMGIYAFLLTKYPQMFGQFAQQQKPILCNKGRFYLLIQTEKVVNSAILVNLSSSFTLFIVIAIFLTLLIVIAAKKPYIQSGGNIRPILNLIVLINILLLMAVSVLQNQKANKISFYAPFIISGLLFICLAYNLYFFIQQFKRKKAEKQKQDHKNMQALMSNERTRINDFNSILLAQTNASILKCSMLRDMTDKQQKVFESAYVELKYQLGRIKQEHTNSKAKHGQPNQTDLSMIGPKTDNLDIF